jgi:hypothetical protein
MYVRLNNDGTIDAISKIPRAGFDFYEWNEAVWNDPALYRWNSETNSWELIETTEGE